jgi:GAF domain-containing protein
MGAPVFGLDRQPLGTLCVLDRHPHTEELPLPALIELAERASQAIAEISRSESG